ncbi:MAG: hypothetical protein ACT4NX_02885 [Deltaproteobacteria bacterium]
MASESGALIGVAAAFPRLARVRGRGDVICWNLGDFAVRADFRSLGPGLMLQRACVAPVLAGEIPFCYDHPNRRMLAIYKRMGIAQTGEVFRFAKPLRVDSKIERAIGAGAHASIAKAAGNALLSLRDFSISGDGEFGVHEGRFAGEFSVFDESVLGALAVYGRRAAEYLNWRYLDNPCRRYEVFTLRRGGRLVAYSVITVNNNTEAIAVELMGSGKEMRHLLRALSGALRGRGIEALSVMALGASALASFLGKSGFYRRESAPFVVCAATGSEIGDLARDAGNWFLTHGDQDL